MLAGVVFLQPPAVINWKVRLKVSELENGRRFTTGTAISVLVVLDVDLPGISGTEPRKASLAETCMLEMGPIGIEL